MEIQRTGNAGVLLKLDGVSILLDGLCDRVEGYLPTPPAIAQQLLADAPDLLAFTHYHKDHCSRALLSPYRKENLRPILGPESLSEGAVQVGNVTVRPVESRHLGRIEPGLEHVSYIVTGSKCVWFMGDAAPIQWKNRTDLPRPDVLIAPYAYGNTKAAWDLTCSLTSEVVLLHLPDKDKDPYGLWEGVESTTRGCAADLWIPKLGETITID
ncbi:MAG: MBL fold metallo-hydrolase [Oscillospiraceae bacterium]|nr:MBL fold metallo-hydrolase [Oscillospiraceae bacterium]